MYQKDSTGLLYIVIGVLLVTLAVGAWVFRILIALLGLWLIQHGLQIYNMSSVIYWYRSWRNNMPF